jgi:hypothetical protein
MQSDIRDPEDRTHAPADQRAIREKMFDKTIADSYPASDPASSLPNPSEDSVCPECWDWRLDESVWN